MTAVKICGITSLQDAFAACDYGAEALGFIFYEPSPRYLKPTEARKIIKKLPRDIATVGVFVNPKISLVRNIREYCPLDFIQLSGDETPDFCDHFTASMLFKVVPADQSEVLRNLDLYNARAFLIDSRETGHFGGTGKLSNWEQARAVGRNHPIILAGGLNPENVEAAIAAVSPEAVDVSSGVEISPGKKDPQKVRMFIERVRFRGGRDDNGIFNRDKKLSEASMPALSPGQR
ncbi:MAG: n-(5-phosphoribosyl)anthranilate isomerase [Deltaproteobacteria bacterium]|nr:n-(5-phosphoribosyl)anthranilate isomerase [Deltaproteobacteria bacterium]